MTSRRNGLCAILLSGLAFAALVNNVRAQVQAFTDSAGRSVGVPSVIRRLMPAGPPADVLLLALAPDELVGLVEPFEGPKKALVPKAVGNLPAVPRLTGALRPADIEAVKKARPDLIVDYGGTGQRYADYAATISGATGIPDIILDGGLARTPFAVRTLARLLHREARGEAIAKAAEASLAVLGPLSALPDAQKVAVYYARGKDGLKAVRPGFSLDEAIIFAGGRNVVPAGKGALVPMTVADVTKLAPAVVVVVDPAAIAPGSPLRTALPAGTRFLVDRGAPFHWMEAPPSLNRLIGARWLAAALHPDQAKFDRADVRDLLGALFGLTLDDATIDTMLK